jgi:hypothetical protein
MASSQAATGQTASAPQNTRPEEQDSGQFQITQETVPSGLRLIPQSILKLLHLAD